MILQDRPVPLAIAPDSNGLDRGDADSAVG